MSNPLTCLHNIVTGRINLDTFYQDIVCVSCNTPRTIEELLARDGKYEYNDDERVFVFVPASRVERTQTWSRSDR